MIPPTAPRFRSSHQALRSGIVRSPASHGGTQTSVRASAGKRRHYRKTMQGLQDEWAGMAATVTTEPGTHVHNQRAVSRHAPSVPTDPPGSPRHGTVFFVTVPAPTEPVRAGG